MPLVKVFALLYLNHGSGKALSHDILRSVTPSHRLKPDHWQWRTRGTNGIEGLFAEDGGSSRSRAGLPEYQTRRNLKTSAQAALPKEFGEVAGTRPVRRRSVWAEELSTAIRDRHELLTFLKLDSTPLPGDGAASDDFPLLVPRSYLQRMRPGDPQDPLLQQVLPTGQELLPVPGFVQDAVGDHQSRPVPGLLHKYQGRALLIATGACAVHCRYCFRRHYPYSDEPKRIDDWRPALDYLAAHPDIHEVLLSGGDPLLLTDQRLADLVELLAAIPHLKRLRWHTRLPIVLPSRVTSEWLELLTRQGLPSIVVVHANHAQELQADCAEALQRLVEGGVLVFNQAVLLRGVNDSVEALAALSERLLELRVVPYYLHQLDRVHGTAHFEVPPDEGRRLMEELRQRLPGYAVPRYVQELAGEPYKTRLE